MPGRNRTQFTSRLKKRGNEIEPIGSVGIVAHEPITAVRAETSGIKVELSGKSTLLLTFPDNTQLLVKVPPIEKKDMSKTEYAALATTRLALNLTFEERIGIDQVSFTVAEEAGIKNLPDGKESDPDAALRWACATLQGVKRSNGRRGWSAREIAEFWVNSNDRVVAALKLGSMSWEEKEVKIGMLENTLRLKYPANYPGKVKQRKVTDW